MNRTVSLVLVGLMLGLTVSGAMNAGLAFAGPTTLQSSGSAYSEFWELLNREASLVVELNETSNTTIAQELIETSREGELNAANISALIWESLVQLRASGVKLHYTAWELREMAENISRSGFPDDVTRELKEQGWSDEEIESLREYIASHANDTMGDFDMGSFLGNFSTAMIQVGFKYAGYEAWALQRNYWRTTKTPDMSNYDDSNRVINPDLTLDWHSLHEAYEANDYGKMYDEIVTLTSDIQRVIGDANHAPNGSVFKDSYYWPGALEAYNLTRQAYVLLQSIKLGNGNEEVKWLLNGKVMGLQSALMVDPKKQQSSGTLPLPPRPIGPIPVRYPFNPPVSIRSDYGVVSVKSVDVVVDSIANGELSYHVRLALSAEGNTVSNVRVTVKDVNGEAAGEVGMISPSDGVVVWNSPEFSARVGFEGLRITGTVSVVYSSTDGPTPLSFSGGGYLQGTGGLGAESGPRTFEITEEYSKTVGPAYTAPNVVFRIEPSTSIVSPGHTVHFRVHIENGDRLPINGYWTVYFSVPDGNGVGRLVSVSGYARVSGGGSYSEAVKNITYPRNGEYSYWGVFKSGDYSTTYSGKILVSDRCGVEILKVSHSPEYPSNGAGAVFNVLLKNNLNYSTSREVKLFIDGKLASFRRVTLPAGGTLNTSLMSSGFDPGWHEYEVTCGDSSWEDRILERSPDQQFAVSLEAFPVELEGGGTVFFTVKAWNFASDALNVQFHVVNENGKVVYPRDGGWISKYLPKGASNYTLDAFSWDVYGVGNHTYTVIARISGEEEKDTAAITVKPVNGTELKQVGSECNDIHFDFKDRAYRASLSCQVYLYNPSSSKMSVKDIAVEDNYSLGQLEDFTLALGPLDVPHGSLDVGKWNIIPEEFDIDSQETKNITFSLPLEISSYVPISGSDTTEVLAKDGSYTEVTFTYTLGYSIGDGKWYHYSNTVRDYVKITMDAKTVAADYLLSGGMAFIDPNTAITFSIGSMRISGIRLSLKLSFDPWAFLWNGWIKPYILEHT